VLVDCCWPCVTCFKDFLLTKSSRYGTETVWFRDGMGNTIDENSCLLPNPNALVTFIALTLLVG